MSAGNGLRWSGRVLSVDDLRRHLNGHSELLLTPGTIVTPLAADEIRRLGLRVNRVAEAPHTTRDIGAGWGYSAEMTYPVVAAALAAAENEGVCLDALPDAAAKGSGPWARAVAECIAAGACRGGLVFCSDPGLACCVANKVKGVRAVAVANVRQAARALHALGANLLAVEMPGPTFFEIRQIARCVVKPSSCPEGVACVLEELEGHAHR